MATSFRSLGTYISSDLSWTENTTAIVKKAQQWLHFLKVLTKNNPGEKLLLANYRSSVESILTYCVSVWFAGCSAANNFFKPYRNGQTQHKKPSAALTE